MTYSYGSSPSSCNTVGRLMSVSNGSATMNYTCYDPMGNVKVSSEQVANQTYPFGYSYNLANALTSETYPSGRAVTNTYDSANRPYTTTGTFNGTQTNYITYTGYWPHGAAWQTNYGSGLTAVEGYNSRLQPNAIWALLNNDYGQVLFGEQPNWGTTNNNGNVQGSTTYAGGPAPWQSLPQTTQDYGYDNLNRLISVSDSGGYSRAFSYDPYGNMWVNLAGTSGIPPAGNTPISNVYNGANQITGMIYDAAGNLQSLNGNWVNYDAENRQISEIDGVTQAVETYAYDGEGRRVEKSGPAGTTAYIYDAFGQLIAEYSTAGSGMSCQTCYLSYDHLGSARLVTDQSNQILSRHDYLPFGEEIPAGIGGRSGAGWGTNDGIAQRFTGKERDTENGLDYFGARYYGSALGRFTSPDWSAAPVPVPYADFSNPQSLNLYSYLRNDPLSKADADGHGPCEAAAGGNTNKWMACKGVVPEITGLPKTPGTQVGERFVGALKGAASDALRTLNWLARSPQDSVANDLISRLGPSTQDEKFGGDIIDLLAVMSGLEDLPEAIGSGHALVTHLEEFADLGCLPRKA